MVLDPTAPNIPFILMDRKGYAIMITEKEILKNVLSWDYDFIVIQNEFFLPYVYSKYPEILSRIEKIADNGKISVCKLSDNDLHQSLYEFMGISGKSQAGKMSVDKPEFEELMTFDTLADKSWLNTNSTSEHYYSGNNSGILSSDMSFGLSFKTKNLPCIKEKSRVLTFSSYFKPVTLGNCDIVAAIHEKGQNTYYKAFPLQDILKNNDDWQEVELIFQLPKVENNDYEFALYIWNKGKAELYIDNFGFKIY